MNRNDGMCGLLAEPEPEWIRGYRASWRQASSASRREKQRYYFHSLACTYMAARDVCSSQIMMQNVYKGRILASSNDVPVRVLLSPCIAQLVCLQLMTDLSRHVCLFSRNCSRKMYVVSCRERCIISEW